MFKCKVCGYESTLVPSACPECGREVCLSDAESREILSALKKAKKSRKYEYAVSGYRALAEMGVTEAQIEYARILERGELVPKDLDLAMKYFYLAAQKNDAYGAYRYSRLLSRHSDRGSRFWLAYSAYLGCRESYPAAAEQYSADGDEDMANYYYSLAAALDDTAAIVTMAKRYYGGVGVPRSEAYAKWYLDKLLIPPFHAIKMAYRLRSVKAEEPTVHRPERYGAVVRELTARAKQYGFYTAYHRLVSALSADDIDMLYTLGTLFAEGVGCTADARLAIELLERAAAHGSRDAYKYLGDTFIAGKIMPRDIERALECYKSAADLGMSNAYEIMGDIFYEGELVRCDIAAAIELYDIAAREGDGSAGRKALALKDEREALFREGEDKLAALPEEAFRAFAISAGMGYLPAYTRLAECYRDGVGVKKERSRAHMWFEMAVEEGDDSALYDLGLCYSRGIGTAFDFDRATEVLHRAERFGDTRAEAELLRLYENKKRKLSRRLFSTAMRLLYRKKFEAARRMLEVCRSAGHPKGIYTLGCMYEFGIGTPTDRELAFSLYETAYSLKFRDPRQVYKLCILKMIR